MQFIRSHNACLRQQKRHFSSLAHFDPHKNVFRNPWITKEHDFGEYFSTWSEWSLKRFLGQSKIPQSKPDFVKIKNPPNNGITATWIGHATSLIQMSSISFLTDPVFTTRIGPFNAFGPARVGPIPMEPSQLPKIDFILISHNHYDHLDEGSISKILHEQPNVKWFVPIRNIPYLTCFGVPRDHIIELDWWQDYAYSINDISCRITCTPAQHFSGRTYFDTNQALWSSFVVETFKEKRKSFFFAGDTGYRTIPKGMTEDQEFTTVPCPAFSEIGQKFGPIDLCAIPIGAHSPRWFMSTFHTNPKDALEIHSDLNSKQSFAIHWGCFEIGTTEPLDEPPQTLRALMNKTDSQKDSIAILQPGETRTFL